jgi:hypothetical protein
VCFSKVGFLVFIAMVINCTTEMEPKSHKIDVVVAAAKKYLGVQGFTAGELQGRNSRPGVGSVRVNVVDWGGGVYLNELVLYR